MRVYQVVKVKNLRAGDRLQHSDGEHVVERIRHDWSGTRGFLLTLEGHEGEVEMYGNTRLLIERDL